MTRTTKVMLSCGEPSGDLYAGALTTEIRRLEPETDVFGLGGERLAVAGGRLVADYGGLAVTGLAEVLPALPRYWATYRRLVSLARAERPDVFVAIDYPDFNFRLGASIGALGIPVVYYISPQVWAWRRGRLRTMKRFVSRALVIFPFEAALYREADIPVAFVGHPLLDLATPALGRDTFRREHQLDPEAPTVAVLPGSRANELSVILPDLVGAAERIARQVPLVQFVVARAPNLPDALFEPLAALARVTSRAPASSSRRPTTHSSPPMSRSPRQVLPPSRPRSRAANGRGLPFVAADLLDGPEVRAGERIRHGEPGRGEEDRAGVSAGGVYPGGRRRRGGAVLNDESYADQTRAALRAVRETLGGRGASRRAAEQVLDVAHRAS